MNIELNVSFQIIVLSGYMCRSGIAGSYATLVLVFSGSSILFSIVVVPIYIPTNNVGGFPFLHTLSSIIILKRD